MLRLGLMLRPLTFTTLIIAGLWGIAHADVYRWVDDHGEPHYSDRWVPGSELIKSSKPHPAESSSPAQSADKSPSASAATAGKQQKANEAAVKQDVQKVKAVQCKQAQERYQKAIESRRIYKPGKNSDDRVYMTDEEIDKYRVDARNDVTLACGSPPAPVQPE
jgi:hypothetical protein